MSAKEPKWDAQTRLNIAAAVAPDVRKQREKLSTRKVAKLDEAGKVVGYTTLAEVQAALLKEREIELTVVEGKRPDEVFCRNCGKPVVVARKSGAISKHCLVCRTRACVCCGRRRSLTSRDRNGLPSERCSRCSQKKTRGRCTDCGKELALETTRPLAAGIRKGQAPRCFPCSRLAVSRRSAERWIPKMKKIELWLRAGISKTEIARRLQVSPRGLRHAVRKYSGVSESVRRVARLMGV